MEARANAKENVADATHLRRRISRREILSYASSFGRMIFKIIATIVATTTGDFPKIVVAQSGNWDRDADAWDTPMPRAAAKPTIEVFR